MRRMSSLRGRGLKSPFRQFFTAATASFLSSPGLTSWPANCSTPTCLCRQSSFNLSGLNIAITNSLFLAAHRPSAAYSVASTLLVECPLNVRVSENSPSLCPTISSVTNTLLKIFPLWTIKVNPTNSGIIVHLLAQVFIGSREPEASFICTFLISFPSTYGPFFIDLAILKSLEPLRHYVWRTITLPLHA